jgi:transposase
MANLITGLYEDWLWLDERIESVTGEIEALSHSEANCRRLMSVPGIGPLISTGLVAAIGTGEAFERGRDFGAWLGLVPRQYSTGGRPILGRISKRGSKYLRTLFVAVAAPISSPPCVNPPMERTVCTPSGHSPGPAARIALTAKGSISTEVPSGRVNLAAFIKAPSDDSPNIAATRAT